MEMPPAFVSGAPGAAPGCSSALRLRYREARHRLGACARHRGGAPSERGGLSETPALTPPRPPLSPARH